MLSSQQRTIFRFGSKFNEMLDKNYSVFYRNGTVTLKTQNKML